MKNKICVVVFIVVSSVVTAPTARADSYSTFQTTRYYSANKRFFVEVTPDKRATLYRRGRPARRVWTRTLPELPRKLFVANDGGRVAMIDFYYGNNHKPEASVVLILAEKGEELARHSLREVAELSRVTQTTSMSYWVKGVKFAAGGQHLVIDTIVAKHERSKCGNLVEFTQEEMKRMREYCEATMPYEQLRFSLATGALVSRRKVAQGERIPKYAPPDNGMQRMRN
jgi:hypothetical protein